jgi:isoleucyl-tRNA synthetase
MSDTEAPKPNYSKTLNIPPPDEKSAEGVAENHYGIPMKADLPRREPQTLAFWNERKIYEKSLQPITGLGTFILHDGPPFSNGNIHIGHAFNKILKDVTTRFQSMRGYKAPYVPGWDNNGLPIEVLVAKEFREKKLTPSRSEIRARCREVATEWVQKQSEQFQRLGIRGDWTHPYLTMTKEMAAAELDVFADLVEKGVIYRGLRPVHWSLVDETALADAEIEYADRTDPSIYVRFPLRSDPNAVFNPEAALENCSTIIWTTTPWTIPANVAVAVGPDMEYVIARRGDERFLVAAARLAATMDAVGWADYYVEKSFTGRDLEGLIFQHPLFERDSPLVLASYVTTSDGTGVVHTAPGHGKDDFLTGQRNHLPTLQILTGNGFFNEEAGSEFMGLKIGPGQEKVMERLADAGALLARGEVFHSYPHGWRSHDPLVFRATVQYFINIDHEGYREQALQEIERVQWYPAESKQRIHAMVSGRPDWCISRQRSWGIGIPVFYAQPSGTPLMTRESIGFVRDLVAREGTDGWFTTDVNAILPAGYQHPETGETEFTKETDIFDVWLDSGSTCRTVLDSPEWPELSYPADVYLEGGDQHRGWFNSSLMVGVATTGHAPFRQVVTNGWTLNEKGEKMSKSQMNGVAPETVCEKYGADVLRLWVCSTDYFNDVKVGDKILEQVAINYRTLLNLYDFDLADSAIAYESLLEIDRWVLSRLNDVVRHAMQAYEVYEFNRVAHLILSFCTTDLSAFYLDILKDRLYSYNADSPLRRSAQTTLFEITSALTRLLAPILPFTAEEIWQKLRLPGKPVSVHLASLPTDRAEFRSEELDRAWRPLLLARDVVNKALEGTKKRLENAVTLSADPGLYALLLPHLAQLPALLLVSRVTLRQSEEPGLTASNDGPAPGTRCSRCWITVPDAGGHEPAELCTHGCLRRWHLEEDGLSASRRVK